MCRHRKGSLTTVAEQLLERSLILRIGKSHMLLVAGLDEHRVVTPYEVQRCGNLLHRGVATNQRAILAVDAHLEHLGRKVTPIDGARLGREVDVEIHGTLLGHGRKLLLAGGGHQDHPCHQYISKDRFHLFFSL